jgi:hypothetical protein
MTHQYYDAVKLRKYIAHVNIFEAAVIIDGHTLVTYSHSTHIVNRKLTKSFKLNFMKIHFNGQKLKK